MSQPNAGGRYYRTNGVLVPEAEHRPRTAKAARRKPEAAPFAGESLADDAALHPPNDGAPAPADTTTDNPEVNP